QPRVVRLALPFVAACDEDATRRVSGTCAEALLVRRIIAWVLLEESRIDAGAEQCACAAGGEVDGEARESIGDAITVVLLRLMLLARFGDGRADGRESIWARTKKRCLECAPHLLVSSQRRIARLACVARRRALLRCGH